jgi:hypothetical protein
MPVYRAKFRSVMDKLPKPRIDYNLNKYKEKIDKKSFDKICIKI